MSLTSTTPDEKRLPPIEEVLAGEKKAESVSLDEQLRDQRKKDDFRRTREIQDALNSVITTCINPGLYVFLVCLAFFSIYLLVVGERTTVIGWLEKAVAFVIGGLVLPQISKLQSSA
ncbi:hypothetical protein GF360_02925 [candidate division WWE3 bacterium]|nr:hypothetical protein [candidate division WWE3 bacterium]